MTGSNHHKWKGNKVGYDALHNWVERQLGKPKYCSGCKKVGNSVNNVWNVHWANKSHKYKRDLWDWLALCRKCHYQYDLNRQKCRLK